MVKLQMNAVKPVGYVEMESLMKRREKSVTGWWEMDGVEEALPMPLIPVESVIARVTGRVLMVGDPIILVNVVVELEEYALDLKMKMDAQGAA